jgi:autotransporter-associated beta strand protein
MTISANNLQNWNGNFTFTGTNSLDLGGGAVTLLANSTANVAANTLTVGGVIDGGFGIGKDGVGTLILTAANTYAGATTINNGTLIFTTSQNLPGGANSLIFGAAAASTNVGTLNLNTVSATFGGSLIVQTNSASVNTITIGTGQTLRINGPVTIGYNGATSQTKLTISGPGTFTIGAAGAPTNSNVQLGGSVNTNVSNAATLDLTGIPVFYANLGSGTFRVGDLTNSGGGATAGSTLLLAPTSTIIATTLTSDSPDSGVTQAIRLGSGTNIINANTINLGGSVTGRSNALLDFLTGTGTLTVRDLLGTGRAAMNFVSGATGTGANPTGTVNFAGHNVDLLLSTLNIAQRSAGATTGGATGTFTFDTGTLDATTVVLASRAGGAVTTGINNGTLNLMSSGGSGAVTIGTLNMAINSASTATTSQASIATVNIGGTGTVGITTVTMASNSIGGGATAQTQSPAQGTINISGSTTTIGTLNMNVNSSANTGTNNASVAVLNVSGGVLNIGSGGVNMANISNAVAIGTSTINLTGGTTTLAGNLIYTAGVGVENTTLNLNGASAILDMGGFSIGSATATIGSGSGVLNLQAGTLRNVAQINNSANWSKTGAATDVLTLDTSNGFGGAVSIDGGVLRIQHGGALGGTTNGTAVSPGTALEISNNITTSAEPLTLNGSGITSTSGALRNTSGDNIYTGAITLGSITRINSDSGTLTIDVASGSAISGNFQVTFGGAGHVVVKDAIDTGASFVRKDGAGTLTLAGANSYTGMTVVSEGKVIVSGSIAGTVDVSPGATLASGNNVTSTIEGAVILSGDAVTGGILAPGDTGDTAGATTIGQLHVNGSLFLGNTGQPAHLAIEIGGTTAGTLYDQVQVASNSGVILTNVNLDLSLANSFNPTTLTLATYNTGNNQLNHDGSLLFIVKGSTSSVSGTFLNAGGADTNLAGFGTYNLGGQIFAISYQADAVGGSFTGGKDIALMAIPEPNSLAMLAGSLGLALGLQRFRRRK